jgi:hypothetical protein
MGGKRSLRNLSISAFIFLFISFINLVPHLTTAEGADIEDLEKRVEELEKMAEKKKKKSIISRTRLGGYVEFEYEDTEGKKSTFDNHRLILLVNSRITEKIRFYTELEYEHGTKEIELEQAYINFALHDLLSVSAGAILVPVGRLNRSLRRRAGQWLTLSLFRPPGPTWGSVYRAREQSRGSISWDTRPML